MNIFNANGSLNKNLVKFAKSLNLELYLDVEENRVTFSEFDSEGEAQCEWVFSYKAVAEKDELFFEGNIYFPKEAKQELPHWINSAAKLKEVISFCASTLKAA